MAPGHVPTFFPKTDPKAGPLKVVLKRRTTVHPASQTILGRVVNAAGQPVPQAVVSVETTQFADAYHGTPPEGTDPLAVTDDQGNFALGSPAKFDLMHLRIEGQALARGLFNDARPGGKRRTFVLTEGATITGRILKAGKPMANVVIGACGADRMVGNFVGDFSVASREDGRFALTYLPPGREYFVYGHMSSLTNLGALPLRKLRPGGDGATLDLGNIEVKPGRRLAGRLQLSEEEPFPPATRLTLTREDAWDTLTVDLPPDGTFDIPNLPGDEALNVGTRVPGFRPSAKNVSYESLNAFGLQGQLKADKTNLVFLLEPGEVQYGQFEPMAPEDMPKNRPLAGIEMKSTRPPGWVISGRVIDAETKGLVPGFRVTPGQTFQPTADFVQWLPSRRVEGIGSVFVVELPKPTEMAKFAVLEVAAPGYLPERTPVLKPDQAGPVIALRKGVGPRGVVLGIDGKAAAGVSVLHLGPGEQAYLRQSGEVSGQSVPDGTAVTDDQGRFEFGPKYGKSEVIVATPEGFARVAAAQITGAPTVRLEPWASVSGRMIQGGRPLVREPVDMQKNQAYSPAAPHLNMEGTVTDEDGRFRLERVPPGLMQLTTREGAGGGWTSIPQHRWDAKPGQSVDVGNVVKKATGLR